MSCGLWGSLQRWASFWDGVIHLRVSRGLRYLAVNTTGWVDTDNDGMLDGFVAGNYDLFDCSSCRQR